MGCQVGASIIPTFVDGSLAGLTLIAANAKNHNGSTILRDIAFDVSAGWLNFQAISTPTHCEIGTWIALTDQQHPESLIGLWVGASHGNWQVHVLRGCLNALCDDIQMGYNQRTFDQSVVRHNVNFPAALRWWNRQQSFEYAVCNDSTVFSSRKPDNPRKPVG